MPPATSVIRNARVRYFGDVTQSGSVEDRCRAVFATLKIHPNQEWKHPPGRSRATWLRTVEKDLAPLNLGLHAVWRSAPSRVTWSHIVNTTTSVRMLATKKKPYVTYDDDLSVALRSQAAKSGVDGQTGQETN